MVDFVASGDAGNGGTNVIVLDQKTGKRKLYYVPSVRAMASGDSLGFDKSLELKYEVVGWGSHRYIVGDDVTTISRAGIERHIGVNRYGNEHHQMLLAYGLAKAGVRGGSVDLTVCTPPRLYKELKPIIVSRFAESGNQATLWLSGEKHPRYWTYENISVIPEGMAAAICFGLDDDGEKVKSDAFAGTVVVIDVGTFTVNAITLVNGSFNPENLDVATWENEGLDTHLRKPLLKTVKGLSREFASATVDDIDIAFRRGFDSGDFMVNIGGFEAPITPYVEKHSERYAGFIANAILDGVYNSLTGIQKVYLVGGGSLFITPFIKNWYGDKIANPNAYPSTKNVHVVDMNAMGGLRWRLKKLNAIKV